MMVDGPDGDEIRKVAQAVADVIRRLHGES